MEPGAAKGGFILLALIGGAILPLQALINARLGAGLGGPIWAAMLSFLIGTITLAAFLLALRAPMPGLHATTALPWWVWTGGLLGAIYVSSVIIAVPALGATALVAFVILGQLLAATLLDHYGVLGAVRTINPARAMGVLLLILGAMLVVRH